MCLACSLEMPIFAYSWYVRQVFVIILSDMRACNVQSLTVFSFMLVTCRLPEHTQHFLNYRDFTISHTAKGFSIQNALRFIYDMSVNALLSSADVTRGSMVLKEGEMMWPPPPPKVAAQGAPPPKKAEKKEPEVRPGKIGGKNKSLLLKS